MVGSLTRNPGVCCKLEGQFHQHAFCMLFLLFQVLSALTFAQQYTISTIVGGSPAPTPANAVSYFTGSAGSIAADHAGNVYFIGGGSVFKLDAGGTITLIAGDREGGFSGDGGAAANARFSGPAGLALDSAGNLYVSDSGNNRIRKIFAGIITTIAGTGAAGYAGDGGLAASAALNGPSGLFVDGAGSLYVAEINNHTVRRISASGIINTVAGNGSAGFSGDGGPAAQASLNTPSCVAVDPSGNIFIADYGNSRVRQVSMSGVISTFAGNGQKAPLGGNVVTDNLEHDGGPAASAIVDAACVGFDSAGRLLIADQFNNRIRQVTSDGIIHTVAGSGLQNFSGDGGPATKAGMNSPSSAVGDPFGNIYVADSLNARVRKISSTGVITTAAGEGIVTYAGDRGPAKSAVFNLIGDLATDASGNLYIADEHNDRIRKVSRDGTIETVAGGSPLVATPLSLPGGVVVGSDGSLYVSDTANNRVVKISTSGNVNTVAGTGRGGYNGDGIPAVSAQLNGPSGLALDRGGNLYVADLLSHRVRRVSPDGKIATVAGTGASAFGADGGPAASTPVTDPLSVALDSAGNLYIGEFAGRVLRVSPNGIISTVAGNTPNVPEGLAVGDGGPASRADLRSFSGRLACDATGNLYLTEGGPFKPSFTRVRKIFKNGNITTIAGAGLEGYTGDGGPGASAQLDTPIAIAVDSTGNVYFSDQGGSVVRVLKPDLTPLSITAVPRLPQATTGVAYSQTLTAIGGTPPYTWSVASGALPSGLTLNSFGIIGGTPATAGNYNITISVTDLASATTNLTFNLASVSNLAITSNAALPPGSVGVPYSTTLTASGATPPYAWMLTGGALPDGLTLSSDGAISGTTTSTGTFSFSVQATDSASLSTTMAFTLVIGIAPAITAISNAASGQAGPVSPGETVVIQGSNLGPEQLTRETVSASGLVDTQLAGTIVFFNGTPAPIVYTSASAVSAVVPYEISGDSAQVTISYQGQTSAAFAVSIVPANPALFTADSSGTGQAAAFNMDGSANGDNPTPIGGTLMLTATGEGQTSPAGIDGKLATDPPPTPLLPVTVTIGGQPATVLYAGGALGAVAGVMQLRVQIPTGVQSGNAVPIVLKVGDASSQPGVTVAVAGN
jgi:uncharacterized protein (TIGR03437 family)